ncbi:MAG TPA: hypothetical protein VG269_15480 [Tepidisphaeraceae bacterium]|nr:hypothetical protein [Tepidisphaeraceae bacterium]
MPLVPCPAPDAPVDATGVRIEPAHRHTAKARASQRPGRLHDTFIDT